MCVCVCGCGGGGGFEKLDDKQIRRRYVKGNWTILQNCNCEKIDESERDRNCLQTNRVRKKIVYRTVKFRWSKIFTNQSCLIYSTQNSPVMFGFDILCSFKLIGLIGIDILCSFFICET